MGNPTGFLLYNRSDNTLKDVKDRIKDFCEFKKPLQEEERIKQAARCMDCGVPMCQSAIMLCGMVTGCPLHNLIPEWNDALYCKQYEAAAKRLLSTSSFPEFTGRVCPALCEKACNCGSSDLSNAVSVHDNELFIIEKAFSQGFIKPRPPKVRTDKKVAVVGSGPAGLAVADMLNRRGHNVTVFERDSAPGGLLMYGIPNMKLDKSIVERRIKLMTQEGVEFCCNVDVAKEKSAKDLLKDFDAVALCCGAKKPRPLSAKGSDAQGVIFAVDFLKSVTKSLLASNLADKNFFDPKGKNVIVLGGGDTGNDCLGTCVRLGAKSIVQIEMMPRPPEKRLEANPWPQWPKILKTDYGQQEAIAVYGHDPRVFNTTIKEVLQKEGKVTGAITVQVQWVQKEGKRALEEVQGSEKTLPCDLILVAAGFLGAQEYTPKAFGVELGQRGTVAVSKGLHGTNIEKVFVAGDVRRGQSLVVWAIAEGRECAKEIDKYLMGYTNM